MKSTSASTQRHRQQRLIAVANVFSKCHRNFKSDRDAAMHTINFMGQLWCLISTASIHLTQHRASIGSMVSARRMQRQLILHERLRVRSKLRSNDWINWLVHTIYKMHSFPPNWTAIMMMLICWPLKDSDGRTVCVHCGNLERSVVESMDCSDCISNEPFLFSLLMCETQRKFIFQIISARGIEIIIIYLLERKKTRQEK